MRNINLIGTIYQATEVLKYHAEYFKNYPYFDVISRSFTKEKFTQDANRYVYIKHLKGEINKLSES